MSDNKFARDRLEIFLDLVPAVAMPVHRFVLGYGREYRRLPAGPTVTRMAIKQCFANCHKLIRKHKGLVYVEGFAFHNDFPVLHAWCFDPDTGSVVEPTYDFDAYFGIAFQGVFVKAYAKRYPACLSLLDNWQAEWPTLATTAEQWHDVFYGDTEFKSELHLDNLLKKTPQCTS